MIFLIVNTILLGMNRTPILNEKEASEYKDYSIDELRAALAEQDMKIKAVEEQKKTVVKGYSNLIKDIKVKRSEILDILEAKDSSTARKVLTEVSRK